jgi:alanyl-tRNA synthetase
VIRYVTIDDLDVNPCCGTHGPSLALLGSVFIYPGVTNISGPTRFRIYFAVGNAVLHHLANAFGVVKIVGAALECGAPDVAERLATLQKARKDGQKREKALRAEAARLYAMDLTSSLHEISNGVIVGNVHREDESTDIELLTLIFNSFQPPEGKKWLVSLSSGPIGFGGGCLLLAGSDEALVKKTGELVKTRLNGRVRGGGGKGRWQGKVVENWQKDDRVLLGKVIEEASLA